MAEEATKQQQIASDPTKSIWVSASAGTGKTTTLTKRLIRLLLNGVEPSKILCLTYTKVGAMQMYQKIHEKLADFVTANETNLISEIEDLIGAKPTNEIIKRARTLFAKVIDNGNDFKIMTIHSFCEKIIKKFPIEANIMPNFEIADDSLSRRLIEEAKDKLFEKFDNETVECIKTITLYKNDEDLLSMLNSLLEKKEKLIYLKDKFFSIEEIERELKSIFNIENSLEDLKKNFYSDETNKKDILHLFDILEENKKTEDLCILKEYWNSNKKEELFNTYSGFFLTQSGTVKKKGTGITKDIVSVFPEIQDIFILEGERLINFIDSLNSLKIIKLTTKLLQLAYKILDIYTSLKRENGVLDYGDLIIYTNKLLSESSSADWVAYKLDSTINHFLLDEAQDTSFSQWNIARLLTQEFFVGQGQSEEDRTIFVVGDEKQSIFEFQDAKPELFKIMHNCYENEAQDSYKDFRTIYSQVSFRSLPIILKLTDTIFNEESRKNIISKMEKDIKHVNVRKDEGRVELYLVEGENEEEDNGQKLPFEKERAITADEKLAVEIAKKIKALVNEGRLIPKRKEKNKMSPIKYGDIMILLKTRQKIFLSYLIKELNKNNIPNSGNDKFSLLDNIIIEDLISLANFLLFPDDDLNLASIIKSPLISLMEDDLFDLCSYKIANKVTLWQAIKDSPKYESTKLYLEDLIEKNKVKSPYELFFYILEEKNGKKLIKQRFIFEKTDELLNEFFNYINKYEDEKRNTSLLNFIEYFKSENAEIKKDMDNSEDCVKILTAHSSKGLESPIVILANSNHTSRDMNRGSEIIWYEDLESGYEMPIFNIKKEERSKLLEEICENKKEKEYNEYLRLLYVAITRAENELYVFGSKKKNSKKEINEDSWFGIIEESAKKLGINTLDKVEEFEDVKNLEDKEETDNSIKEMLEKLDEIEDKKDSIRIINPSDFYSYKDRDSITSDIPIVIKKGNAVHKLLEVLPNYPKNEAREIIDFYLKNTFSDLEENFDEIKNNVLKVLENEEFSMFFSENSKAEVPIVGKIENEIISGQIDRLIVNEDKVIILDYKNTKKMPENLNNIPKNYVKQLELYKKLIEQIYNNKTVECYILWTSFCEVSKIF